MLGMTTKWLRILSTACGFMFFAALFPTAPASAIIGGREAEAPYSFMGSLQRLDSPRDDLHSCGVALIAPNWGLTAGHCARSAADVLGQPTSGHPADWSVRFGSTDLHAGGDLVDVAQFIQLNNRYFEGDLALLRFDRPVDGTPIQIAEESPPPGTAARIMGWGMTCNDANDPACMPQQLREADTQVQDTSACGLSSEEEEQGDLLCIGAPDGSMAPSNTDSGAPAVVETDGVWKLVGTVEGGGDDEPGIYTDVSAHRAWIDGYLSGQSSLPPDTPFTSDLVDGTVQMRACSGAVIQSANSRPTDPAMVLTNGHCADHRPAPGEAILDESASEVVYVRNANGSTVTRVRTTALAYATMTGTDVAVYQLDTTFAELAAKGVHIFSFAEQGPSPDDRVNLLSGGSADDWDCKVEAIVPLLREGGYSQVNALRYAAEPGCGPSDGPGHGDSGSPLVDPDTNQIVGIHATGNDDGLECVENNPCEVDADGNSTAVKDRKYGQQVSFLRECLAAGSVFDTGRPGCDMAEPAEPGASPRVPSPAAG